jgi:hypothetical protein
MTDTIETNTHTHTHTDTYTHTHTHTQNNNIEAVVTKRPAKLGQAKICKQASAGKEKHLQMTCPTVPLECCILPDRHYGIAGATAADDVFSHVSTELRLGWMHSTVRLPYRLVAMGAVSFGVWGAPGGWHRHHRGNVGRSLVNKECSIITRTTRWYCGMKTSITASLDYPPDQSSPPLSSATSLSQTPHQEETKETTTSKVYPQGGETEPPILLAALSPTQENAEKEEAPYPADLTDGLKRSST